ncbi:MAG: sensor histidine kinase, partial [Oscillospiraceae bacterium]
GIGIAKERIQSILLNRNKSSGRYMGVAIGNINKRIKLLCGREYGIGIQSGFGSYTKTEIVIPMKVE